MHRHKKQRHNARRAKNTLSEMGYSSRSLDAAINKAKSIPREVSPKKIRKQTKNKGPVFSLTYDPRPPSVSKMTAKHWRSMTYRDSHLSGVFQRPSPPYSLQEATKH